MTVSPAVYVYALLAAPDDPLTLPHGIIGPTTLVCTERLAALVEMGLPLTEWQTSEDRLLQAVLSHDRVVQEIFQQVTVLPMRFGIAFAGRANLLEHLQQQAVTYGKILANVEHRAEYLLQLSPQEYGSENTSVEASTGRDYFLAKKQQIQARASLQQQQQQQLDALWIYLEQNYPACRLAEAKGDEQRIYLLADRWEDRSSLGERLQALCPDWWLTIGLALPPYHFIELPPVELPPSS